MKQLAIAGVACVIAAGAIAGCGGGGGGSSTTPAGSTAGTTSGSGGGGLTANIAVTNNASAPMGFAFQSPVTVKSGTAVTWVNQSSAPHGITWDAQSPSSSPAPGADVAVFGAGSSSAVFTAPTVTASTTYNYHCTVHGPTMAGQMIVTP